ncbi:C-type lectin domain family 4 member G-like isoform X4 [Acipenser ruthenus]|uniref:C-type lectin domain family 4 member G-like isoform X3 n=1 Tax=Acipenser ruthenus TaxID=7906 RepID=UPI0027418D9A|nr:C-type lectin domain family 4 member G-like isoform X3 [Acipenser ruthenus]XP_058863024.1 C-type lectin domain family 4 member G-like isoform X4 [Acipenser ruthenus]
MADDVYGNSDFHQQTGQRKHQDRERYQAPARDDDNEDDYENIEDSIELEEKRTNRTEAFKEEPKAQAAQDHNVCGTKSIVFLYVLLIASSVMWAALLSLLFVKCTAEIQTLKTLLTEKDSQMRANFENYVSKGTAEIQTLKTLLTEKDSEIAAVLQDLRTTQKILQDNAAVLQDLRTTQKTLQDNDSQLSALVTSFGNDMSHLISKVCIETCPCEWISFNEACYYFSKKRANWHKAKESCNSKNASLAVISSDQELDYLKSRIGSTHYWLGLSDSETEGSWKWLDGRPVEKRFWNSGEPNNAANNEDCGILTSSKLNDIPCNSEEHWICEMKL